MAFKEKSEKELLKMSKEEQAKYWEDFKVYYSEKKKNLQKKIRETEKEENARNKKKLNHARFVLFGALLKLPETKNLLQKIDTSAFTETDKKDCNLLMKSLDWDLEF